MSAPLVEDIEDIISLPDETSYDIIILSTYFPSRYAIMLMERRELH